MALIGLVVGDRYAIAVFLDQTSRPITFLMGRRTALTSNATPLLLKVSMASPSSRASGRSLPRIRATACCGRPGCTPRLASISCAPCCALPPSGIGFVCPTYAPDMANVAISIARQVAGVRWRQEYRVRPTSQAPTIRSDPSARHDGGAEFGAPILAGAASA